MSTYQPTQPHLDQEVCALPTLELTFIPYKEYGRVQSGEAEWFRGENSTWLSASPVPHLHLQFCTTLSGL